MIVKKVEVWGVTLSIILFFLFISLIDYTFDFTCYFVGVVVVFSKFFFFYSLDKFINKTQNWLILFFCRAETHNFLDWWDWLRPYIILFFKSFQQRMGLIVLSWIDLLWIFLICWLDGIAVFVELFEFWGGCLVHRRGFFEVEFKIMIRIKGSNYE